MTEEIIIDGVDVAGCMFLCTNTAGHICCGDDIREDKIPFANFCVENKNCYYKQLKSLEQENKELKKQIESQKGLITVGGKQQYKYLQEIDKLQQENKELKEKVKARGNELANMAEQANMRINTFRSALEEINRVVKLAHKVEDYLLGQDYTDLVDRIEKEINEVLNEEKL